MDKLRVGFVGAGGIMRVHADTLKNNPDALMVAASDVSEGALDESCKKYGIEAGYADYREMLEKTPLDAVFVCTPPRTHAEVTLAALSAGCHVLCEKPPAMTLEEAVKMATAAEHAKLRLFYGLHRRFQPNVQAARKYTDQGRLGEVYHATTHWFRRRGIPGLGSWFTTKAVAGAGALYDIGVHVLDMTHFIMGKPKPTAVSAMMHCRFGNNPAYNYLNMWGKHVRGGICDVEDMGLFLIRFETGASLVGQVSWAANTREGLEVRVMGDGGGVMIEDKDLTVLSEDNGFIADIHPQLKSDTTRPDMLAHFFDCIRNPEKKLLTDARDGIVLQAMLDAIEQSARTNREVGVVIPE